MREIVLLILCILITTFLGWNVICLLGPKKNESKLFFLEGLALAFLFGIGLITIQMFVMGLFSMRYTTLNILVPWGVSMGTGLIINSIVKRPVPIELEASPARARSAEIVLFLLISLQTLYNFFRALIKPIESFDAVAIHGLKSKIIYYSGGVTGDFFRGVSSNFDGIHPDYPLLIPLSETWVYTFLGVFDDILVKVIFPLFYLAFIFIFYAALKRITNNRTFSLLFTFLLASVKQFSDYATIGYADLELGVYFAISIFYLYLWFAQEAKPIFLNISLIATILCLWTKNEGMLLSMITLFTLFLYMFINIKKIRYAAFLHTLVYAAIVLFAVLSWNAFKACHGLVNENFSLSMVNVKSLISGLNRVPTILYEYQKEVFGFKKWNIAWILFFFILLKESKTAFSNDIKYITIVFFLFALGYSLVYIFSAVDIGFLMQRTWSRFLLHILPVAIFWMGLVIHRTRSSRGASL